MSDDKDEIFWRRMGSHLDIKMEYREEGTAGTNCYTMILNMEDHRSIFQQIRDWFNWRFLNGPRIIYVPPSKNAQWFAGNSINNLKKEADKEMSKLLARTINESKQKG